jgi:hypothetical protein
MSRAGEDRLGSKPPHVRRETRASAPFSTASGC